MVKPHFFRVYNTFVHSVLSRDPLLANTKTVSSATYLGVTGIFPCVVSVPQPSLGPCSLYGSKQSIETRSFFWPRNRPLSCARVSFRHRTAGSSLSKTQIKSPRLFDSATTSLRIQLWASYSDIRQSSPLGLVLCTVLFRPAELYPPFVLRTWDTDLRPGSVTAPRRTLFPFEGITQILPVSSAVPRRARGPLCWHPAANSLSLALLAHVLCTVSSRTARIRLIPSLSRLYSEPTVISHSSHFEDTKVFPRRIPVSLQPTTSRSLPPLFPVSPTCTYQGKDALNTSISSSWVSLKNHKSCSCSDSAPGAIWTTTMLDSWCMSSSQWKRICRDCPSSQLYYSWGDEQSRVWLSLVVTSKQLQFIHFTDQLTGVRYGGSSSFDSSSTVFWNL